MAQLYYSDYSNFDLNIYQNAFGSEVTTALIDAEDLNTVHVQTNTLYTYTQRVSSHFKERNWW